MDIVKKYFPDLTHQQYQQISKLPELYQDWNQKINVVSRQDVDELMQRHVLHSLAIAKYITLPDGCKVIDIGTGGGFPGIPLAILFPDVQFTLLDSTAKKLKVVNEVSGELNLGNVSTVHQRAEYFKEKFDYVVSRAVAHMETFTYWTQHLIKRSKNPKFGRIIYLKGGDLSEELKKYPKAKVTLISDYFDEPLFETKKIVDLKLR
ncbi:MAG: 16S rRNA (guanine(527)-N(7))-methyltransferase RsmG [Psychroflexus sp.]|nr:16S rRNA (guanine(527)-N(7))-methyltransferase RsmG [Psychroflexus sp.]MDR9448395.1 16S rRNA (guanine(527)-N(7))-methyltransferase RsmG [Psychroflexus sp.]